MAGDRQRQVATEVLLDQGKGEVHAGGDAGGGPDRTVIDVDRLGVDVDLWVAAGQLRGGGPVGGGAAAVEQAGGGQGEGAGADGGYAACAAGTQSDPVQCRAVAAERVAAGATGDDQSVNRKGRVA